MLGGPIPETPEGGRHPIWGSKVQKVKTASPRVTGGKKSVRTGVKGGGNKKRKKQGGHDKLKKIGKQFTRRP